MLFASSVGWGLTWWPIKMLSDRGIDGMHMIFIAFLSGVLVLSPWLYKQYPVWKKNIGLMLMIALSGGIANASFQTYAPPTSGRGNDWILILEEE